MRFFWIDHEDAREDVNYSEKTQDELLNTFKSDEWCQLSEENRVAVIQEIENRNALEQGREPATIVSMSSEGVYGSYNGTSNCIQINVSDFSSYETLDTYVHESNHAYQAYCIENGIGYDDNVRSMMQAEMARDEKGNLYNYADTSPLYDMQCDELDSNNKAANFLLAERDRYQGDSEYCAYIQERAEHFEMVNSSLQENVQLRDAMQHNQVYNAYARGDISEEQYADLNTAIGNDGCIDSTVIESQSIGEQMTALSTELQRSNSTEVVANEYLGSANVVATESDETLDTEYLGAATEPAGESSEASIEYLGDVEVSYGETGMENGSQENGSGMDTSDGAGMDSAE